MDSISFYINITWAQNISRPIFNNKSDTAVHNFTENVLVLFMNLNSEILKI